MATESATNFWTRMAELERERHQPFRVEARFAQDGRRATPIQIELSDEGPQAVISDQLAALRDKVDSSSIAARHSDPSDGQTWRAAFEEARQRRQMSLNQACRLVLGPVYVPERQVHAYNANDQLLVRASDGVEAPNSVIEIVRDLGRPRADLWEVAVWEDSLAVSGREIFLTYQVHNEAIVTPENVDAIRAVTATERDASRSIARTDEALGVRSDLLSPLLAGAAAAGGVVVDPHNVFTLQVAAGLGHKAACRGGAFVRADVGQGLGPDARG